MTAKIQLQQGFSPGEMGFRVQFARQQIQTADVRFGSKADIRAQADHVCFTPKSRHFRRRSTNTAIPPNLPCALPSNLENRYHPAPVMRVIPTVTNERPGQSAY